MKLIAITLLALTIQSCASTGAPGKMVPANSIEKKEMLESQRGYLIAGKNRDNPVVKEFLLTKTTDSTRYIEVDGSKLIPNHVQIDFGFNSTAYKPTKKNVVAIEQLSEIADRALVVAQTVCRKCTDADRQIAMERARVVKMALIDTGFDGDKVTVSHDAGDSHIPGGSKRYVNINFIVDNF